MAQPPGYTRQYDFEDYQTSNPSDPLPSAQVEAELNAVKTETDAVDTNLALIQRDDGALANGVVTPDSFNSAALALIASDWTPQGTWATATAYVVGDVVENSSAGYVCATAHTSGTFSTDYSSGYWVPFSALASLIAYDNTTSELDADTMQDAIDELTLMSGGYLAKSVAGSADVTLTASEADNAVLKFTGALTGDINVIVPTEERRWVVHNGTSGAHTLTVKTSAGSGVAVTQGEKAWLYGDGTDVVKFLATDDFAVSALSNIVEDTTPQLGGNLDLNGNVINGLELGSDVQAYDAETAKTDVTQSFTAPQRADQATVTDGTLDLSAAQNFLYTPSGADALEFSNEAVGQSGLIYLVNGSNHAISLGSEVTGPTDMATDISVTGNYLISYWVHTAGGGADSVACSYVEVV